MNRPWTSSREPSRSSRESSPGPSPRVASTRFGRTAARRAVIREDATKTGARRRVTVDGETAELLAEARVGREQLAPWLFSDTDGPPNPDRVSWWWKRAREAADIDEFWRLHDLRHWSATQAIAAGYDVQTVARRLGHADATTTLRVYSHAIDRSDPALAEDLGKIMKRHKK